MANAIWTEGLAKKFRKVAALDGVDVQVQRNRAGVVTGKRGEERRWGISN